MLYLSSLLDADIRDSADEIVGRVEDVVVEITKEYPLVTALEVCFCSKNQKVPCDTTYLYEEYIESIGKGEVTLNKNLSQIKTYIPKKTEIKLKESLLDKQIMDSEGIKLVRANDIILGKIHGKLAVMSIDIGFKALIKRLGLGRIPLIKNIGQTELLSWKEVTLVDTPSPELKLKYNRTFLNHIHAADIANILEELNVKRGADFVAKLDPEIAADIFEEVDEKHQEAITKYLSADKLGRILESMSPDEAADVLDNLPPARIKEIVSRIKPEEGKKILELVSYDENEAGGLMTTDYFTARPEWTIKEVKVALRELKEEIPTISYAYITDEDNYLKGVLSLREIILADEKEKIGKMMITNVFTIKPTATIKEIASLLTKYNLFSVAVTNDKGKLLGVVMVDDVMRELFPEA